MTDYSKNREQFWANMQSEYYTTNTGRVSRDLIPEVVKKYGIKSVLELGCNSGGNLLRIHEASPDVKLVGIDICDMAIQYGKEVEKNPAEMLVGSIYDLSRFEDNSFDLVFTRGVLLHINNERAPEIIKEMLRISKKFLLHIETHGKSAIRTYSNGIPHSFVHNFESIYNELGVHTLIEDMNNLTGERVGKGAEHCVFVGGDTIPRSTEKLFVLGPYKGGTTTLMGMLNCHNDIYLEGELFGHPKSMKRFKKDHPEAAAACRVSNRSEFYDDYIGYLRSKNKNHYRYVGEKIATLSFDDFLEVKDNKMIFICRDIRTWLAKPALPRIPQCKSKKWATQFAVEYTSMLIRSFGLSKCYRIQMEELLANNDTVLKNIGAFIGMPLYKDLDHWWERMGRYDDPEDPKGKMEWWNKQPSSLLGPSKNKRDVRVEVNESHPLWKTVLPIFDKYYNNLGKKFTAAERKKDLRVLACIKLVTSKKSELYKSVDIQNISRDIKK